MNAPSLHLQPFGIPVDFAALRSAIDWQQRSVTVYGKTHPQPRLTCWYGAAPYAYSGVAWEPRTMPPMVDELRRRVEQLTGERFNSVLCNLYRDGRDCVGWHADDEPLFGRDPVVASLSFGASRRFQMRRRGDGERHEMVLDDGSLLLMGRGVQTAWEHCVPRTARTVGERINLTFRWAEW